MNKNNQKKNAGALIGAAFLMATSAIGPGFLTQTGKLTDQGTGIFFLIVFVHKYLLLYDMYSQNC